MRSAQRTTISQRCRSFKPVMSPRAGSPDSPRTIVPLALALATVMQSAEDAIVVATNIGGDSDSVASIAAGNSRSPKSRHHQ
jgi:hypothetical protein